jgi:hypothetical protein
MKSIAQVHLGKTDETFEIDGFEMNGDVVKIYCNGHTLFTHISNVIINVED